MLWDKYNELITSPKTFFRRVAHEHTYSDPWQFYVILGLIELLATVPIALLMYFSAPVADTLFTIVALGLGFLFLPLTPYIYSAMSHLGMRMLGHPGFYKTFKPVTYALTVGLPYRLVSLSIYAVGIATGALAVVEEAKPAHIGAFVAMYALLTLVGALGIIHGVYSASVGAAQTHRVTAVRAFLGVFVIPLAIWSMLSVLLMLLFMFVVFSLVAGLFATI